MYNKLERDSNRQDRQERAESIGFNIEKKSKRQEFVQKIFAPARRFSIKSGSQRLKLERAGKQAGRQLSKWNINQSLLLNDSRFVISVRHKPTNTPVCPSVHLLRVG